MADFIEVFNSRTLFRRDLERSARILGEQPHLLPIAVSDAHTLREIGSSFVRFEGFDGSPKSFREAIAAGSLQTKQSGALVHAITAYVKLRKRVQRLI